MCVACPPSVKRSCTLDVLFVFFGVLCSSRVFLLQLNNDVMGFFFRQDGKILCAYFDNHACH